MFRTFMVLSLSGYLKMQLAIITRCFTKTIGLKKQEAKGLRCSGILHSEGYQRFRVAIGPIFEGHDGLFCDCSTAPRWKPEMSQTKSLKLGKLSGLLCWY